jgi:membrane protease YdiL (CAAX protease family)
MLAKLYSSLARSRSLATIADYSASELRDLRTFLAWPSRARQAPSTARELMTRVIFFTFLIMIVAGLMQVLIQSVAAHAGIKQKDLIGVSGFENVIGIVFVSPLVEELIFRLGLRTAVWSLLIVPLLVFASIPDPAISLPAAASLLLTAGVLARRARVPGARRALAKEYLRNYPRVFYLNCFLFAAVHAENYEFVGLQGALMLIVLMPMAFGAAVMGYLRMRDGIGSSMMLHGLNNSIAVGVLLAIR